GTGGGWVRRRGGALAPPHGVPHGHRRRHRSQGDGKMTMLGAGLSDDELLAALRHAVAARQAVPAEFVAAAKNAFAWHNIDAELAQLTYDSIRDAGLAPST